MAILAGTDTIALEICEKLGIKGDRVLQLVLNFKAGDVATVAVKRIIYTDEKISEAKWERYKMIPM